MARTRARKTEDQSAPETTTAEDTSFNPADFDPALQQQAGEIIHGVAESTRIEPEQPTESFAAKHAPASNGHAENAAKPKDKRPGYDREHTDHLTGVTIAEHRYPFLGIIRFAEKPSEAVRALMREARFTFSDENKEWNHPIGFNTQFQDREHLRNTYDEVRKMIRAERGITHSFGGAGIPG